MSNNPPLADRLNVQYQPLVDEIAAALHGLAEPVIASDADALSVGSKTADLVKLGKKVEKARKAEKDEFLAAGKTVDRFFQDMVASLNAIVAKMDKAVTAYQTAQRAKALAAEESERKAAVLFDAPPPEKVEVAAPLRIGTPDASPKVTGRVDWDYEIVDASKLARELLEPNRAAIKARVASLKASGGKIEDAKIEGVRVFEKVVSIYR